MAERRQPKDPAAYKRDRRQAVLRHHPDHGGSADELMRALDEVDRRHGVVPDHTANAATAEQVAAVAVTVAAGLLAVGLSVASALWGRNR